MQELLLEMKNKPVEQVKQFIFKFPLQVRQLEWQI
jgi:hypothetical protein